MPCISQKFYPQKMQNMDHKLILQKKNVCLALKSTQAQKMSAQNPKGVDLESWNVDIMFFSHKINIKSMQSLVLKSIQALKMLHDRWSRWSWHFACLLEIQKVEI